MLLPQEVIEPKASGGLAANLVSTIRSFLPMGAKLELPPGAGKKPVKVISTSPPSHLLAYSVLLRMSYDVCPQMSGEWTVNVTEN